MFSTIFSSRFAICFFAVQYQAATVDMPRSRACGGNPKALKTILRRQKPAELGMATYRPAECLSIWIINLYTFYAILIFFHRVFVIFFFVELNCCCCWLPLPLTHRSKWSTQHKRPGISREKMKWKNNGSEKYCYENEVFGTCCN